MNLEDTPSKDLRPAEQLVRARKQLALLKAKFAEKLNSQQAALDRTNTQLEEIQVE